MQFRYGNYLLGSTLIPSTLYPMPRCQSLSILLEGWGVMYEWNSELKAYWNKLLQS